MVVRFLCGDVREMLATLPDDSVDCVVTSPPYWGLRDYGVAGQLGLEPTLGEHLAAMVDVFEGVRRVLKPTGTLWLNYGDCYATSPNGRSAADTKAAGNDDRTFRDKPFSTIQGALKAKDLCMVPNRLAIALQEAGWWVRSEIIWAKANPMPESIKDRPATSHEKIWMLTKAPRYLYDAAAVRQGMTESSLSRLAQNVEAQDGSTRANGNTRPDRPMKAVRGKQADTAAAAAAVGASSGRRMAGFNERWDAAEKMGRAKDRADVASPPDSRPHSLGAFEAANAREYGGRNLRNYEPAPIEIWDVPTMPFAEAHFATFPPELARRCIAAGCPEGGTVLDPFGGSGTTGLVAARMLRDAILIELNPEYVALAEARLRADLIETAGGEGRSEKRVIDGLPLFAEITA